MDEGAVKRDMEQERTKKVPAEEGLVLQVQDLAQRDENASKVVHVDLQRVRKIDQHQRHALLAADDVERSGRNLQK